MAKRAGRCAQGRDLQYLGMKIGEVAREVGVWRARWEGMVEVMKAVDREGDEEEEEEGEETDDESE